MQILIIILAVLMLAKMSQKNDKKNEFNLDSVMNLINAVSKDNKMENIMDSDVFKNLEIGGMNVKELYNIYNKIQQYMPIIQGAAEIFKNKTQTEYSKSEKSKDNEKDSFKKEHINEDIKNPLSPIMKIADKNITYSLNKYFNET